MIRRLVACLVATLAVVVGAPAHADDGYVAFSKDGVHWSAALPGPLFGSGTQWVPGDADETSFWVRNQGPTAGRLTVDAVTVDDGLLASGGLAIAVRVGEGAWTPLQVGTTAVEPAAVTIGRNATRKITVRVALGADTSVGQDLRTSFSLRIEMFQGGVKGIAVTHQGHGTAATAGRGHGTPAADPAGLPGTGSPVTWWWIVLGAALLGAGVALVVPRRRRRGGGR